MLETSGLTIFYGLSRALADVTVSVGAGEIVALIGHNGAGKTTLLRSAMGLLPIAAGSVAFKGGAIRLGDTARCVQDGLSFVPQGRHIFRDLSVSDNLRVAASATTRKGMSLAEIFELFPVLRERRALQAGSLSGGQQQMLAFALALSKGPEMVLLDEPSTGLAPLLVASVFDTIGRLRDRLGTAFLVVDQNVDRLLALADRAYVVKAGRMIAQGDAKDLARSDLWSYF